MRTKQTKKRGFTLIELLVVISIIAVLMSIMIPALRMARQTAQNVICKSNLRGIGLAALLWAEDNDGWSLPGLWDREDSNGQTILKPYLGDAESGSGVGLCPAVSARYAGKTYQEIGLEESYLAGTGASVRNYYSSYGYNQNLCHRTTKPLGTYDRANHDDGNVWGKNSIWYKYRGNTKIATIRKPAEKIMFAESYLYLTNNWIYDNTIKPIQNPSFKDQSSRGRRHFPKKRQVGSSGSELCGIMNIAWIDGTVSEEPDDIEEFITSSRQYKINAAYWRGD